MGLLKSPLFRGRPSRVEKHPPSEKGGNSADGVQFFVKAEFPCDKFRLVVMTGTA